MKIIFRANGLIKLKHPDGHVSWGYVKEIAGRKYRASGYRSRANAEAALDALKLRRHLISIGAPLPPEAITFKRLKDEYLEEARDRGVSESSLANSRAILDRFEALLERDALVTQVSAEHLREYRRLRRDAGVHPHTLIHELKRIRTALIAARRLFENFNWLPPDTPQVKRVHKGRKVILSEQQIADLLAAAKPELRDLVIIALHSALRANELLELDRSNVDFSAGIDSRFGRLHLISKKSGTADTLPLTEQAAEILRRRLAKRDRVFTLNYPAARRAFKRACNKAGIAYGYGAPHGAVLHSLRHTAASYLLAQRAPLHVAQTILRHSNAEMTLHYTHAQPADVGAAIESLGKITKPA